MNEATAKGDPLVLINGIGFLNIISWHIMFATGSMIKNQKIKNIADGITQVHKLYLQHGFKITHMKAESKVKLLIRETNALGMKPECESKK